MAAARSAMFKCEGVLEGETLVSSSGTWQERTSNQCRAQALSRHGCCGRVAADRLPPRPSLPPRP